MVCHPRRSDRISCRLHAGECGNEAKQPNGREMTPTDIKPCKEARNSHKSIPAQKRERTRDGGRTKTTSHTTQVNATMPTRSVASICAQKMDRRSCQLISRWGRTFFSGHRSQRALNAAVCLSVQIGVQSVALTVLRVFSHGPPKILYLSLTDGPGHSSLTKQLARRETSDAAGPTTTLLFHASRR